MCLKETRSMLSMLAFWVGILYSGNKEYERDQRNTHLLLYHWLFLPKEKAISNEAIQQYIEQQPKISSAVPKLLSLPDRRR